jgi:hypothetical protein
MKNHHLVSLFIIALLIFSAYFVVTSEKYNRSNSYKHFNESEVCAQCGGRIVFAQVFGDAKNSTGMGWVL